MMNEETTREKYMSIHSTNQSGDAQPGTLCLIHKQVVPASKDYLRQATSSKEPQTQKRTAD